MKCQIAQTRSFEPDSLFVARDNTTQKLNERFFLKRGNAHVAVNLTDIVCFYHQSKVVFALVANGSKYLAEKNLKELEQLLDPRVFFRVNRHSIINGRFIHSFRTINQVKVEIEMEFGSPPYHALVSQKRAAAFRKWLHSNYSASFI